jgi:hypothetical protein
MSDNPMGGLGALFEQVQNMQKKVQEATERAHQLEADGSAGAGLVTVRANGLGDIISIHVEPSLFQDGDAEMLQDLVRVACNHAIGRAREQATEEVQKVTGSLGNALAGMGFPGGFPGNPTQGS